MNPAKTLPGLFFRGVIGYSLLLQQSKAEEKDWDKKGGLHWGVSTGYETAWGFFVEYAYTQTYTALGLPEGAMGPYIVDGIPSEAAIITGSLAVITGNSDSIVDQK